MNFLTWITENWELVCILLGVLVNAAALVYNIYKLCRSGKLRASQNWLELLEAARRFEVEAEGFAEYSSAEKLHYVLSRLRNYAAELGCAYDEERLIEQINNDIAFTKAVNADKSERLE
ncbi:MAG: hypothetical protein IJA78_06795 [Clostridia bacterium]|nr:hypothetical protein [Clostridia bacterium]